MRRFVSSVAYLAAIACLAPPDRAEALLPLGMSQAHVTFDEVACRPPPWFRGWQDVAPFVCGGWWWWPRYYNQGVGIRHRHRYRDP